MMNFPNELYYSKEHTWLKVVGDEGFVGITEFAQSELGEIVFVELPNPGASFGQDEVFGSVEAIKTVSDLFLPVSGEIVVVNKELEKQPTLINSDPFGDGWIIKIMIQDKNEINSLLNAEAYKSQIGL